MYIIEIRFANLKEIEKRSDINLLVDNSLIEERIHEKGP